MEAHIKSVIFVLLILAMSVCSAQDESSTGAMPTADEGNAAAPSFPYVAQITADDVLVRSGPGTNHYDCGKLNKGDKVTVVGSLFGWSRIVPPPESFSWISASWVKVDPANPNVATVTSNELPVYVGSEGREPIHSNRIQLKLNRDDKVTILGTVPQGGYYKIAPPAGAYLWVSTRYAETVAAGTAPAPPPSFTPSAPPEGNALPARLPVSASLEEAKLAEFYELQKQTDAERAKPMAQQNYADIKKAMLQIANNPQAGKAARYAEFAVEQIGRFELALEVAEAIRLQDEQLEQTRKNLATARSKRLAEIKNYGKFAVMGRFETFATYGSGHYRIVDDSNKTVCYALPAGAAAGMDLSGFIGKKVGLIGTIEPHKQTQGALVRFTGVEQLQ